MTTPPKTRPLTRAKVLENRAFLAALRRTGNVEMAARELGLSRHVFRDRRARFPAFAAEWDAALVTAAAALSGRDPEFAGNEGRIARSKTGRYQLRRRRPGSIDRTVEQTFLAALSATANVSLSAAAAGFSSAAFYTRARAHPGFAREWRLALQTGAERLEAALIAGFSPLSHQDDAWRHNEPPAIPPMSAEQALMLLQLHHKTIAETDEPPLIRRRRGESSQALSFRLGAMYDQRQRREREKADLAEAERQARGEEPYFEVPIALVDLAQLTLRRKAQGR